MKSREEFHEQDYLPALRKRTGILYVWAVPVGLWTLAVVLLAVVAVVLW